jgi:23S rRNA (uridine2552-2'-O)-methyltransferase
MKRNPDYYSRLAKDQGYQARSVYKLMEIQEKYRVIKPGDRVLDIGASPGSWSSYVLSLYNGNTEVTSVDLNDIKIEGDAKGKFTFFKGNIYNEEICRKLTENGPYNVVLSDAAPSTSGDIGTDAYHSYEIGDQVLKMAKTMLRRGGSLILKIFQGSDEALLLKEMRALFDQARGFKPKASRSESKEIYYLGFKKKGA